MVPVFHQHEHQQVMLNGLTGGTTDESAPALAGDVAFALAVPPSSDVVSALLRLRTGSRIPPDAWMLCFTGEASIFLFTGEAGSGFRFTLDDVTDEGCVEGGMEVAECEKKHRARRHFGSGQGEAAKSWSELNMAT